MKALNKKQQKRGHAHRMTLPASLKSRACDFSIVIPAYNEEENLAPLANQILDAMLPVSASYEVIFVNDGSTDGTDSVLAGLCRQYRHFHSLTFEKNCGQTAAFDAGFKAARGKAIITMDADLQYDPQDIRLLLKHLGEYDAVCGYRAKRADTLWRRISSCVANFVRNHSTGESIRDVGCSLRAMKKNCIAGLKLFEGLHRFLPTLIKMDGYKVIEVPVSHFPRRYGVSKYNARNRLFKSFRDLMAVRWMKKRQLDYKIVRRRGIEQARQNIHKKPVLASARL